MDRLFVDFETYFSTKEKYDLKSVSMTEYIRDDRFTALGMGYKLTDGEAHWLTGEHVIRGCLNAMDWANTIVIAHNVKFDGAILAWRYGVIPSAYVDTQCMAKAVLGNNVASYSLRALAEYFGLEPKGELKTDGLREPTKQQLAELGAYCKHDTELCAAIFEKMEKDFPINQFPVMDWTVRCFIEPKLQLDVPLLKQMVTDEKQRRDTAIEKSGVTKDVLASNKKFSELLTARDIFVPKKVSARTGKAIPALSLADEGFLQLKQTHPDLYEARVAAKSTIQETRGEKLIHVGNTGAFPFDVQFSGAVQTHRFAGSNGGGGNPQNFPRKGAMREAVCAPAGCELVVGDFAAIELRIISWLAKEPRLINALVSGNDIYSEFAGKIYNHRVSKQENPVERQFGKVAVLGLGYGMGAEKFRRVVGMQTGIELTDAQAYRVVDLYRDYYFNIPKLWAAALKCIPLIAEGKLGCLPFAPFLKVEKNAVILPSRLKIRYPNLRLEGREWVYDVFRKRYQSEPVKLYGGKLIENICQALAGDICKYAIARCQQHNIKVVGAVHDELLAVSDSEEDAPLMKRFMEMPVPFWPNLKLVAEVGHGKNWAAAKAA